MYGLIDSLHQTLLGISILNWGIIVGTTLIVGGVLRMVVHFVGRSLSTKMQPDEPLDFQNAAADLLQRTSWFFYGGVGLYMGIQFAALPNRLARLFSVVILLAVLLQVGLWGNRLLNIWLRRYKSKEEVGATAVTARTALSFIGRLVMWSVILLVALDNLGVDVTTLVTGLGIGGVAVALAVQNVLGDLFASLSIVFDRPFEIGDFLIVGDHLGTVEHIGLKTTRIRSLSGEQLVFSNSDLLNRPLRNFKRMEERRVMFTFSVVYQTPPDKLEKIPSMVREIIESTENTRFDRAHFKEYGDSSLVFEVVHYVGSPDYNLFMDVQQSINFALFRRFREEDISFAYPTRTLHLQDSSVIGTETTPAAGT